MISKKIFSLLGLLFIQNRITVTFAEDCNVISGSNCIQNSYYLVEPVNNEIKNSGTGSLYFCKGEPVTCMEQSVVGYYVVDSKTYYSCEKDGNNVSCTKNDLSYDSSKICKNKPENIGKLFLSSSEATNVSICLNGNNDDKSSVELISSNSGNYLLYKNVDPTINVFGITGSNEKFAIVSVKDKVVTLNDSYSNNLKYVYANSDTSKIMEKGDKCPTGVDNMTPDTNKVKELICQNGKCKESTTDLKLSIATPDSINIFKKNAEGILVDSVNEDFTSNLNTEKGNLQMYYCDEDKNCERINGYAKIVSSWYAMNIDSDVELISTSEVAMNCTVQLGKLYNDNITHSYHLCLAEDRSLDLTGNNDKNFIIENGISSDLFQNVANKMVKVTANYIYVDPKFKAENGKNYIVEESATNNRVYKYSESNGSFETDVDLYGAKNYKQYEASSNIYVEYPLLDTSLITTAPTDWKLFNCRDGECLQTYGYMKSHNENKYFMYDAENSGTISILSDSDFKDCSDTLHVNHISSTGQLCIGYNASATPTNMVGPMKDGAYYIVGGSSANVFVISGNVGFSNSAVVMATAYSLTTDNRYKYFGATLTDNAVKISTSAITDTLTNVKLYDCKINSVCTTTNGYAKKGDSLYKFASGTTSGEESLKQTVSCTGNFGEVITDAKKYYFCHNSGTLIDISQTGFYPFDETVIGSGTFSSKNQKMILISEELIGINEEAYEDDGKYIVKFGDEYKDFSQSTKAFSKGTLNTVVVFKHIPNTNMYSEVSSTTVSAVTRTTDISDWALFDCDGSGSCYRTYGYYKASNTAYLSMSSEGNNAVLTPNDDITNNACTADTDVGKLIKVGDDIKLCFINHTTAASQVVYTSTELSTDSYLLSIGKSNIFSASATGKSIIIKGTSASWTIKKIDDVYSTVIINSNTRKVDNENYTDLTQVAILKCLGNVCEKVNGFTENSGSYYQISTESGATAITPAESTCTQANIGKIITISSTKTLCLNTDVGVTTQPDATVKYVIGTVASAANNPLITGKMIEMTNDYIVVDDSEEGDIDANYIIKSGNDYLNYKYTASTKTFSSVNNISGMKIFEMVATGSNVFKEVTDLSELTVEDITKLLYVECGSGKCTPKDAYLLIGRKAIAKCGTTCDLATSGEITNSDTCTSTGYTEVGKLSVKNGALQLCMADGANQNLFNLDAKVYYTGDPSGNILKYIGNEKKDIIYLPKTEIGYYLVKNNALDHSGDTIVKCNNVNCEKVNSFTATCTTGQVGLFTANKELCLTEDGKKTAAIGTSGSFLISFGASSAFSSVISSSKVGVVKADSTSIILDTAKTNICVNTSTKAITTRSGTTCSSGNEVYTCSNTGLCLPGTDAPTIRNIALPECTTANFPSEDFTTCDSVDTVVSYCLNSSDGKIYPISGTTGNYACGTALTGATHIFSYKSEIEIVEFNLSTKSSTEAISSSEAENLMIYICNSSDADCTQTIGYAKVKVYSGSDVGASDTGFTTDKTKYCKLADGVCTVYEDEEFDTNAYLTTLSYYKITEQGGEVALAGSACTSGSIGLLDDNYALCLDETETIVANYAAVSFHVLTGNLAAASYFKSLVTATDGSKGIAISSTENLIYYNKLKSATTAHAINIDTMKDETLGSTLTGNEAKLRIYECLDGICNRTAGYVKGDSDYYLISATAASAAETGESSCSGNIGKLMDDGKFCNDSTGTAIASISGNFIIHDGSSYKFVRGSANMVSITDITGNLEDGVNAINVNSAKTFVLSTSEDNLKSEVDGDIAKNLALYYCNTDLKVCSQTYGYIKTSDNKYYAIPTGISNDNTEIEDTDLVATCADGSKSTDYGMLFTGNLLCLGNSNAIGFGTNGYYKFKETSICATNPFTYTGSADIIIEITNNAMVINPYYDASLSDGIHLIELTGNKKLNDIDFSNSGTVTVAAGLTLQNCKDGVCTNTYGFVKVGDDFYKITDNNGTPVSAAVGTGAVNCDSGIAVLLSSINKLCIDTDEDKAVDFTTEGTAYYTFTAPSNSVFSYSGGDIVVRKVENAIVLENVNLKTDNGHYIVKIGADYKLFKFTESSSTVALDDGTNDGINAFNVIEDGNVYELTDTLSTSVLLFNCASGLCNKSAGYIKTDATTIKKCTVESCDNDATSNTASAATCNAASSADVEKVVIDSTYLKFCMDSSTAVNTGTYLFAESNNMYIFGTGIVGMQVPEDGYYLIEAKAIKTGTNDTGDNLISCTGGSCTETGVASAKTGFYKNTPDETKYIQCTESACSLISPNADCNSAVGLLNANGELCLGSSKKAYFKGTDHTDDLYMIAYNNNSIFKEITSGNSGLIKANTNSLTFEIPEDDSHYCVVTATLVSSTYDAENCDAETAGQYTCNDQGLCIIGDTAP